MCKSGLSASKFQDPIWVKLYYFLNLVMKKEVNTEVKIVENDELTPKQMVKVKGGKGANPNANNDLPKGSDKRKRPTGH